MEAPAEATVRAPNLRATVEALFYGDVESALRQLALGGINVDVARAILSLTDKFGDALTCLSMLCPIETLREYARADDCESLRWAARSGHTTVLLFLRTQVGLGASDARARNNEALRGAAERGHVEALRVLRDCYNLGAEDARACGAAAVILAALGGHAAVLRCLRATFGLNASDARVSNSLALQCAGKKGHPDAIIELRDGYGLTADDARIAVESDAEAQTVLAMYFGLEVPQQSPLENLLAEVSDRIHQDVDAAMRDLEQHLIGRQRRDEWW